MTPSYIQLMNRYGKNKIPFLFVIDFLGNHSVVIPLNEAKNNHILYSINEQTNIDTPQKINKQVSINARPMDYTSYKKSFEIIHRGLLRGDSYLANFTCPCEIDTNLSLKELFYHSKAKYKLYFKHQFIVFSPETFIKIKKNEIFAYPMKGTIDATIFNAENVILSNEKEKAEHYTIVDLIRNDISQIAENVLVTKFRYVDRIKTSQGELLQISSEIKGKLPIDYYENLGDYFYTLLPAGSICGAPKKKTMELIKSAENYQRGYYTGVFGYFDGENMDSGVMIRFIEKTDQGLVYKSGGGITHQSEPEEEYKEMIKKIYVPIY